MYIILMELLFVILEGIVGGMARKAANYNGAGATWVLNRRSNICMRLLSELIYCVILYYKRDVLNSLIAQISCF